MDLSAANAVRGHERFPCRAGSGALADNLEEVLQSLPFPGRLRDRHSQPVQGLRPRRRIPEFRHVPDRDV